MQLRVSRWTNKEYSLSNNDHIVRLCYWRAPDGYIDLEIFQLRNGRNDCKDGVVDVVISVRYLKLKKKNKTNTRSGNKS